MRGVRHLLVIGWGLWLAGLGCAAVGVTYDVPFPGTEPFDRALMAYARGDLAVAKQEGRAALERDPHDLRAHDLLCAIGLETGSDESCRRAHELFAVPDPLSPETLLRLVMHRNPQMRQAVLEVVAARAQLREAQVSYGPELMVLTRFHPAGVFARLIQSMLSGLFEREALMDQAEAHLARALGSYAQRRAELSGRAADAYIARRESDVHLRWLAEAKTVGDELERIATILSADGVLSKAEHQDIQTEVSKVRRDLALLHGRVTTTSAELARLIGMPDDSPFMMAAKSVAVEPPEEVRAFFDAVAVRHPRLVAAQARVREADARKNRLLWALPRLDLRGTYGSSTEEGRGDFLEGFSIGLRVRTPLLIWPLQHARSDREEAFLRILEREVERVRHDLWVEVIVAVQGLQDAQQELQLARQEARAHYRAWQSLAAKDQLGVARDRMAILRAKLAWIAAERRAVERYFAVQRAQVRVYAAMDEVPGALTFVADPLESYVQEVAASGARSSSRALWVWRPDFLGDARERAFFFEFLRARNVKTLFLFASRERIHAHPAPFRTFLRFAHARGFEVQALNGEPTWILPGHEAKVIEFFEAIDRFNREGTADERFDAVHLDVEITRRELRSRPEIGARFVAWLERADREARRRAMRLVLDIPAWFDDVRIGSETLLDRIVRPERAVAVMAYLKNPSRARRALDTELKALERAKGTLWVGVSADPAHLRTSIERGDVVFEKRVRELEQELHDHPAFKGIAIHDYDRYRAVILSTPLKLSMTELPSE
ncbi:MAG: TolC family protein [Nitrospirae bacterium]|nr:MAG: TolC family protein [Nitrospirota bacterium]